MTNVSSLTSLINFISKLPSLGERSARRISLKLMEDRDRLSKFIHLLDQADKNTLKCKICGNFDNISPCNICNDDKRVSSIICVVECLQDLWALERSGTFNGKYHILGGLVSSIHKQDAIKTRLKDLCGRVISSPVREVIIALPGTLEGQTTLYYIQEMLENLKCVY